MNTRTRPALPDGYRYPFPPFPTGWYFAGRSSDLAPGQLDSRTLAGREIVVWRTRSGKALGSDAYCPHMGAHFGHGGRVDGEELWCPFHGFCFDGEGSCTKTGYDTPPPKTARLAMVPVVERHGLILAWHDALGRDPTFEVPEIETDGWTRTLYETTRLRAHPQETTENSVDVGHLMVVHGYSDLETLEKLRLDGDHLTVRYAMKRPADFLGKSRRVRAEFTIHVYGLGYSRVEVEIPELGLRTRHLVLATPIDGEHIELTIGLSVHDVDRRKVHPLLGFVPQRLVSELVLQGAWRGYRHDVAQDHDIWQHKAYIHPPQLARGDGPVGRYRVWARRFYPEG